MSRGETMSDSEFQHILAQARLLKNPKQGALPPPPPRWKSTGGEPELPPSPLTKQGGGASTKGPGRVRIEKRGEKKIKNN